MTGTTKLVERWASDAGVTFEGFEDIKIPSRHIVQEKLDEFVDYCLNARKPTIRVILGEWGEGKTDAYKRYLVPRTKKDNNLAFFVSASTLSNGYDLPNVRKLLETTSLSAVRFLTVLFNSIREESKEGRIPNIQEFDDANEFLNHCLKNLIGEDNSKKIFVFVDEFEELLLKLTRLNEIISGIKEVVNGRFPEIDENGTYPGSLHLILAATPDAFYKLQVSDDTSLIFGGLGRRAGVIELPTIPKSEGIDFLFSLLRYCYKNTLPRTLPFLSCGILQSIFRICQGNPGSMVALFTRALASAKTEHDKMNVIDSPHFLRFLEKEKVFVYGGQSPCLEAESLRRLMSVLEDQRNAVAAKRCSLLFKTLAGELGPFSIGELEKRIEDKQVKNYASIVNNELKNKEGLERTIIKVAPPRQDKQLSDVMEAIKGFIVIENDRKYLTIDAYAEPLELFQDRITFFEFETSGIKQKLFLPSDRASIQTFFEGVSYERAIEIENLFQRKLISEQEYYVLSDQVQNLLFPTPIPKELEFVTDRQLRMKIWRDIGKNLAADFSSNMPQALINIIELNGELKIRYKTEQIQKTPTKFVEIVRGNLRINSLFFAKNSDITPEDVEDIAKWKKATRPPIHCVFVIYAGEITEATRDKIRNKNFGKDGDYSILLLPLHTALAKRFISVYRAHSEYRENVNENVLATAIDRLVGEIGIEEQIDEWLSFQTEKGLVIHELRPESTSNVRQLADTLRFFININQPTTLQDAYEKNRNDLMRFIRYEAKLGLIPDIEEPQFARISDDLVKAGFLSKKGDIYEVSTHPVEKYFLDLLQKQRKLSQKELEENFILESPRLLRDVFIPLLEYKGLISTEGDYYVLTDRSAKLAEVRRDIEKVKRLLQKDEYVKYGYLFMTKERGQLFFHISEFSQYIENLEADAFKSADEDRSLRTSVLIQKLIGHFTDEISPLFDRAAGEAVEVQRKTRDNVEEFRNSLETVSKECDRWLKLQFSVDSVVEVANASNSLKEIERLAGLGPEDVSRYIKQMDKNDFSFRKTEEETHHFNPKLHLIAKAAATVSQQFEASKTTLREVQRFFTDLDEKSNKLEKSIRQTQIPDEYQLSKSLYGILRNFLSSLFPQLKPVSFEVVKISQIDDHVRNTRDSIEANLDDLNFSSRSLAELAKDEKQFVQALGGYEELSKHASWIFDTSDTKQAAIGFVQAVQAVRERYHRELSSIRVNDAEELLRWIEAMRIVLGELRRELDSNKPMLGIAFKKIIDRAKSFVTNTETIMQIIRGKYERESDRLPEDLSKIKTEASVSDLAQLKLRASEFMSLENNVRSSLYDSVKGVLGLNEVRVLEIIGRESRGSTNRWVSTKDLEAVVEEELKLNSNELQRIVEKLAQEGLLKQGVGLSL